MIGLVLLSCVLLPIAASADEQAQNTGPTIQGEWESRTNGDKINLKALSPDLEIYLLRTPTAFEFEFGPRLHLGPLTLTGRIGGVWLLKQEDVRFQYATNAWLKSGPITAFSVNEFSFDGVEYLEGFLVINLGWVRSSIGMLDFGAGYEHYDLGDLGRQWVVGPRLSYKDPVKFLRSINVWCGVTDNPTAMVSFAF